MSETKEGIIVILSSPSGAGKTTLVKEISKRNNFQISISHTTRKPRPNEKEGKEYYFVNKNQFTDLVKSESFFEYANIFGNYYGTLKKPVLSFTSLGKNVVFDIDWQGTQQLQEAAADDLVKIFILPPTAAELEKRLNSRAQDSADVVASRMAKASDEISHYPEYDYIIVNEDAAASLAQVQAILTSERLKRGRQTGLSDFVKTLREAL